jgi:hypothetical protein
VHRAYPLYPLPGVQEEAVWHDGGAQDADGEEELGGVGHGVCFGQQHASQEGSHAGLREPQLQADMIDGVCIVYDI